MNYEGTIIEESLADKQVLDRVKIIKTDVESVTEEHKTPWVDKWTLHKVEITEDKSDQVAELISRSLDPDHEWYADFKNDQWHYIIFRGKTFKIDKKNKEQYDQAKDYGISLGIPEYQVDFHPDVEEWER